MINEGTFSLLVLAASAAVSVQAEQNILPIKGGSQWDRGYDIVVGSVDIGDAVPWLEPSHEGKGRQIWKPWGR